MKKTGNRLAVFCFFSIFATSSITEAKNAYWPMKKTSFWYRAYDLYADGFRNMTWGKTLWAIILIKLFVIFFILKLFFFPNFLKQHAEKGQEADFVASEFVERGR